MYDSILLGILRERQNLGWEEKRKVEANGRRATTIFRMKPKGK